MKKSKIAFIAAIAVAAALAFTGCASEVSADTESEKTIVVNGKGAVEVTPDIAYVELGVRTERKTALEAQDANAIVMEQITAALNELGIGEEDIKTSNFSLSARYEYNYSTNEDYLSGYMVSNILEVTTRDVDNVSTIIDAAIAAGANVAHSVRFGVEDEDAYYSQALSVAMEQATDKASVIAQDLGTTLGSVINVTEGYHNVARYSYANYDMVAEESAAEGAAMRSTPIYYDDINIDAEVTMTFGY
ncbi:MAG: SIMPL domain-containing protein [Firmicutes bacterium]|nr:SIMPL domain-containing protein [Bacillota bacterium]